MGWILVNCVCVGYSEIEQWLAAFHARCDRHNVPAAEREEVLHDQLRALLEDDEPSDSSLISPLVRRWAADVLGGAGVQRR